MTWQALPSMPTPSSGFVAGLVGDQLLVIGGTTWSGGEKRWLNDVAAFSLNDERWSAAGSIPEATAYAAFGCNARGLYWLGGSDGQRTLDGFYHAVSTTRIERVVGTGYRVVYAGAAIDDEAMYVVGGAEDASDLSTVSDRFLRVDLDTGEVAALPAYPGGAVMLSAAVRSGDDVLVFGGMHYDAANAVPVNTSEAYAYSLVRGEWRAIAPLPWSRRGVAACCLDEQTVLIGGGFGNVPGLAEDGFAGDAVVYVPVDDRYRSAVSLPYAAMGQSLLGRGGELYIAGGEDRPRQRSAAFYRLDLRPTEMGR